ncbi:MAG: copper homeostasis protein CutC [Saprospiraceae bacterium]
MKLEICANSLTSALNAQAGGADRVELCSELSLGGVTPSAGLIELVRARLSIEVFVLIRPRAGNFYYSNNELEIIKNDILFCKKMGCDGVVIGALNRNGTVNIEAMRAFIDLARPMKVTFHRAFDVCQEPIKSLNELIELGVDRVLTSGQQPTAIEGIGLLEDLLKVAQTDIIILAGSGVNTENVAKFYEIGIPEIHFSAKKNLNPSFDIFVSNVKLEDKSYSYWESSEDVIRKMTMRIQNMKNDKN